MGIDLLVCVSNRLGLLLSRKDRICEGTYQTTNFWLSLSSALTSTRLAASVVFGKEGTIGVLLQDLSSP